MNAGDTVFVMLSAALVMLILNGYIQKWITGRRTRESDRKKSEQMKQDVHIFKVEGMTCNHCKATVEQGLGTLPEVSLVLADPDRDQVTIQATALSENDVIDTVEKLGYNYSGKL